MAAQNIKELTYKTSRRIILPALTTIFLFVTAIFFLLLPQLEENLLTMKKKMIRELTETTWSLLVNYYERELSGELSREEAQKRAILRIRELRYGEEKKDYFWINDMDMRMIMHPYRPDLEGTDVSNYQDPTGKYFFVEFIEIVQKQNEGFTEYLWQWMDDNVIISPKLSYIKGFEPWGWVIGTGLYINDVHAEIAKIRKKLTVISLVILLAVTLLSIYSIRETMLSDRQRLGIFMERERLLKNLEKSRNRYQNLIETTSDWIWETDAAGQYTYSSPKVKDLIGHQPHDIINKTLIEILTPQQAETFHLTYEELFAAHKPINGLETNYFKENGEIVVLENNAVPIFNEEGSFLGYRGVARDITARKNALEEVKKSRDNLKKNLEETATSLASTAEKRDPYTAGHQQRVDLLACAIARELGLSEEQIEGLHFAALLHDIGKIILPFEYLTKPTKLSKEEIAIINTHPTIGYEILQNINFPWPVAEMVYQHHEHLDGSGYPRGLTDEEILLEAKILTVADVFEAISAHRPYRPSLGINAALDEIRSGKDIFYHGPAVDACIHLITDKQIKISSDDLCPIFI